MRRETFDLTEHNARIFFSAELANWYGSQTLSAVEAIILLRYRDAFAGKRVLDIGVGSGRTTRFLLPFAASYTGFDLSPQMIAIARRTFPRARMLELDMREIGKLTSERFDFILGPWGVLDALSPEDRLKTLSRIAGLCEPGGMFVLSSHNRNADFAGKPPKLVRSKRPDRTLAEVFRYARACRNYRRMEHLRSEHETYALYNDMAHNWQGVFYYIDREAQIAQLADAGFQVIEVLGEDGRGIGAVDDTSSDGCLHYVAVRQ